MKIIEVIIDVSDSKRHTCKLADSLSGLQVICCANGHFRMVNNGNHRIADEILMFDRDETFNSITGLNGSGKSNILDSICFVLGITNMSTVRAQNLQVCHSKYSKPQP